MCMRKGVKQSVLSVCQSVCQSSEISTFTGLRWHAGRSAEVNENINLGYSQDQGYS